MGRARLSTLEADETGDRPGGERRAAAAKRRTELAFAA